MIKASYRKNLRVFYHGMHENYHSSSHEVFNQGRALENFNLLRSDPALLSSLHAFQQTEVLKDKLSFLEKYGITCGKKETIEMADAADKNKPTLRQFSSYGERIDMVDYHPAYHILMDNGLSIGAGSYGYNQKDHISRAALIYMQNQVEPGHCCPIVMTCAAIPVLCNHQHIPELKLWLEKVLHQGYDSRNVPIEDKAAITMGMSMTEKQGGSDVRANTTLAKPVDPSKIGVGQEYLLAGHKWFTSAPMSDGFFTLAKLEMNQPPSLFLVPRWMPNGSRNKGFQIMRLKDKCADRANASSEIEYHQAWARLLSEPGKGVKAIMEMVSSTRLDCCLGSAGTMRRGLQHVLAHVNQRQSFGSKLRDHPLMENLLVDLCVESIAHTMTAMRLASAYHRAECEQNQQEGEFFRIGVAVSKYYITKRHPNFAYECMEIFGGNGFAEDFPMARIFRHSPLNSIWEGSGNIIALDVLRGIKSIGFLLDEINLAKGKDVAFDRYFDQLMKLVKNISTDPLASSNQRQARLLSDQLAMGLQASLLLRYADNYLAECYISSRIIPQSDINAYGCNYGSFIHNQAHSQRIIDSNLPIFSN
jgi:putative acyl-CoA dehydrogenase